MGDKKPRVLVFGRFYDPHNSGGVENVAQMVMELLNKEVDFINLVPAKTLKSFQTTMPCGVPVWGCAGWKRGSISFSPLLILKAHSFFKTFQPDILHLHFPDPMSHLASLVLPKNIPRVISWHADIVRQKKLLKIYRPFLNHALKTTQALVVATPAHKNSPFLSEEFIAPEKIHIVPFAVQDRFFCADEEKVRAIRQQYENKKIVFALGRHVSYKGFFVLLKALAQMPEHCILLLGGQGPLTQSLKKEAENLNIAHRVVFLGGIADEDLPAFYHACDVFCLPSITPAEAFGLVQLEAMAAAKPVVSTRLNTGVDFVNQHQKTGLTVPPNDENALKTALNQILENEDLQKTLGAFAQRRAREEFSLAKMKEAMLQLYQSLLCQKFLKK